MNCERLEDIKAAIQRLTAKEFAPWRCGLRIVSRKGGMRKLKKI